jgi:Ca2+:H+ antiporter
MNPLLKEIQRNPALWLLAFVPVVLVAQHVKPEAHTLLFVLRVLAILPLAALLSHTAALKQESGTRLGSD